MIFGIIDNLDGKTVCSMIGLCGSKKIQEAPVKDVSFDQCDICTLVSDELLTVLKNDEIETLVKQGVEQICSVVPLPNCASMVDNYVDMAFGMIKSLNGKTLCSWIGLCSSGKFKEIPVNDLKDSCAMCTTVVDEVLTLLKSEESIIKTTVDELCSIMPIPDCKETMDNYIKMIFGFIENLDGKTVCSMIGLCGSKKIQEAPVKDVSFDQCDICTLVSDELLTVLKNDEIETLVKQGVEQICSVVPLPNCASMVDNYVDMAFKMIKNLNGKTLCSWIGLCSSEKLKEVPVNDLKGAPCTMCTTVVDEVLTILKSEESIIKTTVDELCSIIPIPDCKETMDNYIKMIFGIIDNLDGKTVCSMIGLCGSKKVQEAPVKDLKDTCSMCTVLAEEILTFIKSEDIKSFVKEGADEICQIFPGIVSCTYKIDNMVDKIFNKIGELEGSDLCSMFGMCSASLKATKVNDDGDEFCHECESYADIALSIIRSEPNFEQITRDAVEDLCSKSSVANCREVLNNYADIMLDWIKNMDGKTFCKLIAVCPLDTSLQSVQDILCPQCKTVVNILLKELLIPSNWALIEFSLKQVCLYMPIPNCKSSIHEIIEKIHDFIKGLDSTTICTEIGICSGSSCNHGVNAMSTNVGGICSECTMLTSEIISLVTNPQIDGIVKTLLETFCAIVPIQGCANIADSFVDMVIDEIKSLDPKTLCGYIGLC